MISNACLVIICDLHYAKWKMWYFSVFRQSNAETTCSYVIERQITIAQDNCACDCTIDQHCIYQNMHAIFLAKKNRSFSCIHSVLYHIILWFLIAYLVFRCNSWSPETNESADRLYTQNCGKWIRVMPGPKFMKTILQISTSGYYVLTSS